MVSVTYGFQNKTTLAGTESLKTCFKTHITFGNRINSIEFRANVNLPSIDSRQFQRNFIANNCAKLLI